MIHLSALQWIGYGGIALCILVAIAGLTDKHKDG